GGRRGSVQLRRCAWVGAEGAGAGARLAPQHAAPVRSAQAADEGCARGGEDAGRDPAVAELDWGGAGRGGAGGSAAAGGGGGGGGAGGGGGGDGGAGEVVPCGGSAAAAGAGGVGARAVRDDPSVPRWERAHWAAAYCAAAGALEAAVGAAAVLELAAAAAAG